MKAWLIHPDGRQKELELRVGDGLSIAHQHLGDITLDLTRVRYNGHVCTMVVDDMGHDKALPVNAVATAAYLAACIPGTTHQIRGPVVIFDQLLP